MLALLQRVLTAAVGQFRAAVRSALRSLILISVAGVLVLLGLIVLSVGIYQSLAEMLGAWQAGGILALGLLAVAMLLLLIARAGVAGHASSQPRPATHSAPGDRDEQRAEHEAEHAAAELGVSISRFLSRVRPEALDMVIGAFIAGMLMSRDQDRPEPDGDRDRDRDGGRAE